MTENTRPVVLDYQLDSLIGSASFDDDGRVHIVLTDPRVVEYIKKGKKDLIRGFSLTVAPAGRR